jgi:type 1 glutamine amidotransferase
MYKFRVPYSRDRLRVLLSFDMSKLPTDVPNREDGDNAIAWIQQVGKGRVFYCSFGHDGRIFRDPRILQFYLDGIQYALGDLEADATPSAKLDPQPKPTLPPEKK